MVASSRSNIGFQPARIGVRIIGYSELIVGLRGQVPICRKSGEVNPLARLRRYPINQDLPMLGNVRSQGRTYMPGCAREWRSTKR